MSILRQLLLVSVLLVQAVVTAAGGSLVLCIESGSITQFELLSGSCCDLEQPEWSLEGPAKNVGVNNPQRGVDEPDGCLGCEDQKLAVASLERHRCDVPTAELAPGIWNALELFGLQGSQVGAKPEGADPPDLTARGELPGILERGLLADVVQLC